MIRSRGRYIACLERTLDFQRDYRWATTGPSETEPAEKLAEFLDRRVKFDSDSWLIELDIAHPERFIAETTSTG